MADKPKTKKKTSKPKIDLEVARVVAALEPPLKAVSVKRPEKKVREIKILAGSTKLGRIVFRPNSIPVCYVHQPAMVEACEAIPGLWLMGHLTGETAD